MKGYRLQDVVMEQFGGPVVWMNERGTDLITINGAYMHWWAKLPTGRWEQIECKSGHPDLYTLTVAQALDLAAEWGKEGRPATS